MNRKSFIESAGGCYRQKKGWSWLRSRDKRLRFWRFFTSFHPESGSIYGNFPIHKIIHDKAYSIEHVIPCSILREHLHGRTYNGASINPFNLMPAHQMLNIERGNSDFDFDNDSITSVIPIFGKRKKSRQISGRDHEREWVLPMRSRGDVARSLLYMMLTYPLSGIYVEHHATLIKWARQDRPSRVELEYNAWVSKQWRIQNPLIQNPDLLKDPSFIQMLTERHQ
jgi:hypothetical protein